eukprot:GHVH01006455.1.p1 GENE.GHVH01006455.1~~GHVH01006455.1.p1  ORF type:complete len:893 (+),score=141.42 GHVH01006455.1:774-3452(+)
MFSPSGFTIPYMAPNDVTPITDPKNFILQDGGDFKNNQWDASLKAAHDPRLKIGWDFDEANTIRAVINISQSFAHKDVESCDFKSTEDGTLTAQVEESCQPPNYNAEYHPLFGFGPHSYGSPWCRENDSTKPLHVGEVELPEPRISNRSDFMCTDPWHQAAGFAAPYKQSEFPWGPAGPSTGSLDSLKSIRKYLQMYLFNDAYPNYLYNTIDYDLRKVLIEFITCCSGMESWYRGSNHFLMECKPRKIRHSKYELWSPGKYSWDNLYTNDYSTYFPEYLFNPIGERNQVKREPCYLCQLIGGHGLSSSALYSNTWEMETDLCCWQNSKTYPWFSRWTLPVDAYESGGCPDEKDLTFTEKMIVDDVPGIDELDVVLQWGLAEFSAMAQFMLNPPDDNIYSTANVVHDYTYLPDDYEFEYYRFGMALIDHPLRGDAQYHQNRFIIQRDQLHKLNPIELGLWKDTLANPLPYANAHTELKYFKTATEEYPNPFDTRYAQSFADLDVKLVQVHIPPVASWDDWIYGDKLATRPSDHDPWNQTARDEPMDHTKYYDKGVIEEYFTNPKFLLESRDYYSKGPEDAHWREAPVILAAAHACPNLRNDPFVVHSCTSRVREEHCIKELDSSSAYHSYQNLSAIKKCQALIGKNIGGCRKDPYSVRYPDGKSSFKYANMFQNSMLWKLHDAPHENLTSDSQRFPSEHKMSGAQYCTSTEDEDEHGNACPIDLCSCEAEITGFSIAHKDFFLNQEDNPFNNLSIQQSWWSDCFDFEYQRPMNAMNKNVDLRLIGAPAVARSVHVPNLGDGEAIIDRLLHSIISEIEGILEEVDTCSLTSTAAPPGPTDTTENMEVIITPVSAAVTMIGIAFATFASIYASKGVSSVTEAYGVDWATTQQKQE